MHIIGIFFIFPSFNSFNKDIAIVLSDIYIQSKLSIKITFFLIVFVNCCTRDDVVLLNIISINSVELKQLLLFMVTIS